VGDSRERGRQHGEALRAQIGERAELTLGFAAGRVAAVAAPWWRAISGAAPQLAAEVRGIAEGAGRPVAEVVLLNAFEAADLAEQVELGGCTLLGAAAGGGSVIGQNWDANGSLAATVGVHRHRGPDLPATLVLASPGGLGWAGMNAHGLAMVSSDLVTSGTAVGLPSQALRRLALREAGAAGALAVLRRTAPVGGRTYLLGDAESGPLLVETAAGRPAVVLRRAARLAHTNHALDPRVARREDVALRDRIYPSSRARLGRAEALLAAGDVPDAARIGAILADHRGRPFSLCRHPAATEPTATAATLVFDCRARVARVGLGNPCTAVADLHDLLSAADPASGS
jgi:isopenicillin-N N-acyltransferase-like protein